MEHSSPIVAAAAITSAGYEPSLADERNGEISRLTPEERVTRLRDELLLVRSGEQFVANYLSLLESLRSERERLILGEIFKDLTLIRTSLSAPKST